MKKMKVALCAMLMVVACGSVFAKKAKAEKKAKAPKEKAAKGAPAEPYTIKDGDGIIGYFTFDEDEVTDNEIIDHSGQDMNIYSGALDGTVYVDEGKNGKGIQFNGEDEFLTIDAELLEGDGFTFAAWVNPTEWKDWMRVFDIGDGNQCDCWCGMDAETKMLRMDLFGDAGAVQIRSPLPPQGKWTHIAAVVGGGKAALYVNGKVAQKIQCPVSTAALKSVATGIYIGRSNWAADPLFNGIMDDLVIAKRAFSDAEIASLAAGVKVGE